jgi:hypothetical protein
MGVSQVLTVGRAGATQTVDVTLMMSVVVLVGVTETVAGTCGGQSVFANKLAVRQLTAVVTSRVRVTMEVMAFVLVIVFFTVGAGIVRQLHA